MCRQKSWLRGVVLIGFLGLAWAPVTLGQTSNSSLSGIGYMPQGVMGGSSTGGFGLMAVPMMGVGTQQGTAAAVNSPTGTMMDPLGLSYVYGATAIPMSRTQAGLYMLSAGSQMSGMGNGQLSGVRPGVQKKNSTATGTNQSAAHTRNANIPGGLAARYFNRNATTTAIRSRLPGAGQNFKRPSPYFPKTAQ